MAKIEYKSDVEAVDALANSYKVLKKEIGKEHENIQGDLLEILHYSNESCKLIDKVIPYS